VNYDEYRFLISILAIKRDIELKIAAALKDRQLKEAANQKESWQMAYSWEGYPYWYNIITGCF
jgi:hypothetical protein